MKRRNFLKTTAIAGLLSGSAGSLAASSLSDENELMMSIGICADLHQDLITDGPQRLQGFIDEMNRIKPDFILQMGDFCEPKASNQVIMDTWNKFAGQKYHVIGNHDRDGGFSFDDVVKFWDSKGAHYSFDYKGYHFVVLNGNEKEADDTYKGYPRSVGKEQRIWMEKDIEATALPTIIFCHQGIDNDMDGVNEGNRLRIAFEDINKKAGFTKVQLVFSGHHHENYHNVYNGVHYVQINSISYQFSHPEAGYDFIPSKEPIWAVVNIYTYGLIKIKGKKSEYRDGLTSWKNAPDYDAYPTVPEISDRVIRIEKYKV